MGRLLWRPAMIALLLAALAFAEPDTAPEAEAEPAYGSAAHGSGFLTGRFSNAQQYENAPEEWREAQHGTAEEWLDLQYAAHTQVEAPGLGGHVIYVEWRSGAEDGPVSRQRIWVLREDDAGMLAGFDLFELRDPDSFAGRADEEGAFASLTGADLIGYPENCRMEARSPAHAGYYFAVDIESCVMPAESGDAMRFGASLRGHQSFFTYREWGSTMDHQRVFSLPGAPYPYAFRRLSDEG